LDLPKDTGKNNLNRAVVFFVPRQLGVFLAAILGERGNAGQQEHAGPTSVPYFHFTMALA
jgi:hypothetical protein